MKRAELLKNTPPGKPTTERVVGNLFHVEREPVLELRWYRRRYGGINEIEPELILHFVWKGHWATFRDNRWTTEKLNAWYCISGGNVNIHDRQLAKGLDEEIQTFLQEVGSRQNRIEWYEDDIVEEKRRAAVERKEKRITKYAKGHTPPLPKGFIAWAKKQAKKSKTAYVYLLQATDHGIIDRRFVIHGQNYETVEESSRGWCYTPGSGWDKWCYGVYWDRYGRNQRFSDKNYGFIKTDKLGILYPKNLDEIHMVSKSALIALKTEAEKLEPINFGILYEKIQRDERAERIVKSGYKELIRLWRQNRISLENVKPTAGVHEMLDVSKGRYRLLRKWNADLGLIEAAQMSDVYFQPIFTDKELEKLKKVKTVEKKRLITNIAKETHLSIVHIIKLVGEETEADIRRYYDYLMMARQRGQDTSDEIVYRNKRWREFHDRWNAEEKMEKAQNRKKWANKAFKGIKEKAAVNQKHFGWEYKGYVMTPAKKASEIIDEGCLQHHCVGSSDIYMERMAKGQSFILFLRKKEDKETPYYTIEAEYDGTVKQAYGAYDRKPDWEEVDEILKKWKKEVSKRARKELTHA